ncbi:MAG: hypothetical protein K2J72_05420 [Oscillospiraceae bacterium]|nr:hypothetical protein [Oscillospiraceae bacterium]
MKAKNAISKVAQDNGISVEEVRAEIQKTIDEGMKSTSPQAVEFWKKVPRKGEKPTPEEFIDYMREYLSREL